jgi:hypothetical protein
VEILTIALLYCRTAAVHLHPHHHRHHNHKPDPPSAYPSFPNAHVIFRLSRSLARSPVVDQSPPAPTRPLHPVLVVVQRPAPSSASLDPLSSRLHARPRRCHLRYHQSSRGLGIAPYLTAHSHDGLRRRVLVAPTTHVCAQLRQPLCRTNPAATATALPAALQAHV